MSQARQRQPARVGHLVVSALTRPIMGITFRSPWQPWIQRSLLLTLFLQLTVCVTRKLENFRCPVRPSKLVGKLVTRPRPPFYRRSLLEAPTTPTNPRRNYPLTPASLRIRLTAHLVWKVPETIKTCPLAGLRSVPLTLGTMSLPPLIKLRTFRLTTCKFPRTVLLKAWLTVTILLMDPTEELSLPLILRNPLRL